MIRRIARAFGVDPVAFGLLHGAFWTLSRRATSGLLQGRAQGKERGVGAGTWIYLVLGGMASLFAAMGGPRDLYGTSVLGMTLVLVTLAIVADFAAVVVAPGDDEILFHLPLSSRTYLAARATVAARHTAVLSLAYAAIPALVGAIAWKNALYAPLLLLVAVWTGVFALLLSFLVYRVALRLLGGERLRTLLAFVPGVLSLAMMFAPQFLPSRVRGVDRAAAQATLDGVGWALPPSWFSAMAEAALGAHGPATLARAAIGLSVVPLGAWLLVFALGRGFLSDLQRLVSDRDAGPARPPPASRRPAPGRLARALFPLSTPEARAGWLLYAGAMRSRASRARLFPMLVVPFVFVAVSLFRGGPSSAYMGSMAVYVAAASAGSMVALLPYHEHRDGAWLLEAAPLSRYGRFYLGVLWAMLARHVLPPTLALAALSSALGPSLATAGGALHGASGALLSTAFVAGSMRSRVPFSQPFAPGETGSRSALVIVNMLLLGLLGAVHAVVALFVPWAFVLTVPAVVAISVSWLSATGKRLDAAPPEELRPAPPAGRRVLRKRGGSG